VKHGRLIDGVHSTRK